ncbi:SLAM family member 9-like isoform X1 [Pristis pectinata]|uniref:SLAM family member 9-like isoform X1 n=1 Tax=Pristis pectinata TaxID=685728 RepID=UPI00223DB8A2|nr:SLAM family member 9-like isoform X1 [Pristis pectinata]
MQHSSGKAGELLWILAALHSVTLCRATASASVDSVTTIPVGGSIRFPILHSSEEKYEVTLGQISPSNLKILAWKSDSPETPYVIRPSYRHRVHFQQGDFIELRDVQLSDHGTYEVQTNYFGSELRNRDREQFELCVGELVSEPEVQITRNSSHLTLSCSAVSSSSITYRWESWTDTGVGNYTFYGTVLYLLNDGLNGHTYTCIAEDRCSLQSSHPVTANLPRVDRVIGSRSYWTIILVLLVLAVLGILVLLLLRKSLLSRKDKQMVDHHGECRVLNAGAAGMSASV